MINPKFEKSLQYRKARRQVREIRAFYIHVAVYCLVMPFLVYINLTYSPDFYWFPFSALGWGFGLLYSGLHAFQYTPFLGKDWERRKIEQFMEEDRIKQQKYKQHKSSQDGN